MAMKLNGIWATLLLLFLLVGCGLNQAESHSATKPTILRVVRINMNRYAPQYPPFSKTIQDASTVQYLYQRAYTLLFPPKESCSPSTGSLVYRLDFYQGTHLLQEMNLGVTGCAFLSFSATDFRVPDQAFLQTFRQSLHLFSLT